MKLPRVLKRLLWVWGVFAAVFFALLAFAFFLPPVVAPPVPAEGETTVILRDPSGAETPLSVDLADNQQEWSLGLMNRPVVERPMLFAFDDEAFRAFWMKNTLVPLDIAYFRADGTWVSSARMEPCVADPCVTYPSTGPAKYALESAIGGIGPSIGTGWTLEVTSGS